MSLSLSCMTRMIHPSLSPWGMRWEWSSLRLTTRSKTRSTPLLYSLLLSLLVSLSLSPAKQLPFLPSQTTYNRRTSLQATSRVKGQDTKHGKSIGKIGGEDCMTQHIPRSLRSKYSAASRRAAILRLMPWEGWRWWQERDWLVCWMSCVEKKKTLLPNLLLDSFLEGFRRWCPVVCPVSSETVEGVRDGEGRGRRRVFVGSTLLFKRRQDERDIRVNVQETQPSFRRFVGSLLKQKDRQRKREGKERLPFSWLELSRDCAIFTQQPVFPEGTFVTGIDSSLWIRLDSTRLSLPFCTMTVKYSLDTAGKTMVFLATPSLCSNPFLTVYNSIARNDVHSARQHKTRHDSHASLFQVSLFIPSSFFFLTWRREKRDGWLLLKMVACLTMLVWKTSSIY